jgi:hypothetical protein
LHKNTHKVHNTTQTNSRDPTIRKKKIMKSKFLEETVPLTVKKEENEEPERKLEIAMKPFVTTLLSQNKVFIGVEEL